MFDEQLKLQSYVRGFWLTTLPGELPFGVTSRPGGGVVASFPTREGLERWLHDQPIMASQAHLLRRKPRR